MTAEDHIDAVLAHLADGRIFPDVAPLGTLTPYITYQAVGGEPMNYLSGDLPSKQHVRMQVNVWGERRIEASEIGMLVEDGHNVVRKNKNIDAKTGRKFDWKGHREAEKAHRNKIAELEFGSAKVPAYAFMRPAYESKKQVAVDAMTRTLTEQLTRNSTGS